LIFKGIVRDIIQNLDTRPINTTTLELSFLTKLLLHMEQKAMKLLKIKALKILIMGSANNIFFS